MALDQYFTPRTDDENIHMYLYRCMQYTPITIDWCLQARNGHQSTKATKTAKYCAARLLVLIKAHWHLWQHEFIGSTQICVLDLLFVVWAHLEFAHKTIVSQRSPSFLANALEKIKRDWHRTGHVSTIECLQELTHCRNEVFAHICTQLAQFDVQTLLKTKRAVDEMDTGINVHEEFNNRVKDIDETKKASTSTTSDAPPTNTDHTPINFVKLGARIAINISLEVDLLLIYPNHHTWDKGPLHTHAMYQRMSAYLVTPETENLLRDLHVVRHLPLGAICHALRTNSGRREQISLETLAHEELGGDTSRAVVDCAVQACAQVAQEFFSKSDPAAWRQLNDDWLLVLWDREVRTHVHLSPLVHYIILQQDLAIKQERWRDREVHGQPRLPLMIEAWGRWCVCYERELWWCTGADQALACWATHTLRKPYEGKSSSGKDLRRFLLQVTGEE